LHSGGEFDIIPAALQMRSHQPPAISFAGTRVIVGLALSLWAFPAQAQDPEPPGSEAAGSTRQEVLHTLQEVQRKFGADAVMLQGHLLGQAIRGGSIVDAAVSVGDAEERGGKRFLTFRLDTGIIFNDRDVAAPARLARLWTDIVETSLRQFRTLTVPADGIAFLLGYTHKPYADEADLRLHLRDGHGDAEAAAFYLLLPDVSELIAKRITPQELLDRSSVLVNGSATRIILDADAATPPAH
jgi:hypothetical protein